MIIDIENTKGINFDNVCYFEKVTNLPNSQNIKAIRFYFDKDFYIDKEFKIEQERDLFYTDLLNL